MNTITVSQFNKYVKDVFNSEELLHSVNVAGEVFGVSRAKSMLYFSIKDEESALPCVCFNGELFASIVEGQKIVVSGGPNYYTKSGRFNYVVSRVEKVGKGELYQKFIELKEKLEKEGLFDTAHKKKIPESIKRIGVVTSKDGAVIQDIKNVAWRRNPSVEIVLYPCKVQGNNAEREIADGINFFSTYPNVDVVIVARGGGSMEDLAAYNTELVARATYECEKPIVSAVGHETDFTIIDFVSDLRAPTPSAGAEILTADTQKEKKTLGQAIDKIKRHMMSYLNDELSLFQDTASALTQSIDNVTREKCDRLLRCASFMSNNIAVTTKDQEHKLNLLANSLEKLDPKAVLRRGYAKIEQGDKPIATKSAFNMEEDVKINFADGSVLARPIK